jgi:hypothetical protein
MDLRDSKDNHQFLKRLLPQVPFLGALNDLLRANPDADLSTVAATIKELAPTSVKDLISLVEILYEIFIRENVVGPSVY